MPTLKVTTDDGSAEVNSAAIFIALQILNKQPLKLPDEFLDRFGEYYPNFKPRTQENFEQWVKHFVQTKEDAEVFIGPVLRYCFQFNIHQNVQKALVKTEEYYNSPCPLGPVCQLLGIGLSMTDNGKLTTYAVSEKGQPIMHVVRTHLEKNSDSDSDSEEEEEEEEWGLDYKGPVSPIFDSETSKLKESYYKGNIANVYNRDFTVGLMPELKTNKPNDEVTLLQQKISMSSDSFFAPAVFIVLQILNKQPLKLPDAFLDRFGEYYPNFKPRTQENFEQWVKHFVETKEDAVVFIGPVFRYWRNFNKLKDVDRARAETEKNYRILPNDNDMAEICQLLGIGMSITEKRSNVPVTPPIAPQKEQPTMRVEHTRGAYGSKSYLDYNGPIPNKFDPVMPTDSPLRTRYYKGMIENVYNKKFASALRGPRDANRNDISPITTAFGIYQNHAPRNQAKDTQSFIEAMQCGNEALMHRLINDGMDINYPSSSNQTALHIASSSKVPNSAKWVEMLLSGSSMANHLAKDSAGWTPVQYAIYSENKEALEVYSKYRLLRTEDLQFAQKSGKMVAFVTENINRSSPQSYPLV